MQTEIVKKQLLRLIDEINEKIGHEKIFFAQQRVSKGNMSLKGGNGRMWINPSAEGYDVSLSGASLEKEMYPVLKKLFVRSHDGYKQANSNTGNMTGLF